MNCNNSFTKKYIKFKQKYIDIKNNQICGTEHENIYYEEMNQVKSFWHDIPLFHNIFDSSNYVVKENDLVKMPYNMVIEIEVDSPKKMEVSKELESNPIVLDRILKYPIPFNYGALPQTYEDPDTLDPILHIKGDADPLDICNVSNLFKKIADFEPNDYKTGDICQVRIIGIIQIIDSGEADWKMVGIDINLFAKYVKLYDEYHVKIEEIMLEWFRLFDKYEAIEYYDVLHKDLEFRKKSISIVNTVLSHSIESYNKKFQFSHNINTVV